LTWVNARSWLRPDTGVGHTVQENSMEEVIARFYAWSVIGTTLILLAAYASTALRDGRVLARWQRSRRMRWLAGTRLHAVLVRRGIAPTHYLDATAPARMVGQLRNCEDCAVHRDCDDSINSFAQTPPVEGCPNRAAILAAVHTG
jgi:hypothetical protein